MFTRKRGGKRIRTIAVCGAQVPFRSGGAEEQVNSLVHQLRLRNFQVETIRLPFKWYPLDQLFTSIQMWEQLDLTESDGLKIDLVITTKFPSYFVNHPRKILWLTHQYRQAYDLLDTPYSGFDLKNPRHKEAWEKFVRMDTLALKSYPRIYTIAGNTSRRLKKYNGLDSTPLYHLPRNHADFHTRGYEDFVLCAGRLDSLKRVDLLIRSLVHTPPQVTCRITGTGPELPVLKKLARKKGLESRIQFLGHVSNEDLLDLYSRCRLVFFAPYDEDYGYITLEAFLARKPVITAFDSGEPLEFVKEGVTGTVLEKLDEQYIGQKIRDLFLDPRGCRKLGENGYRSIQNLHWDQVIDTLLSENNRKP